MVEGNESGLHLTFKVIGVLVLRVHPVGLTRILLVRLCNCHPLQCDAGVVKVLSRRLVSQLLLLLILFVHRGDLKVDPRGASCSVKLSFVPQIHILRTH